MADRDEYEYKFILLGDSGVGKSTFFHRIRTGEFLKTDATVGRIRRREERLVHSAKVRDQDVKAVLYDTRGEEHYRTFTTQFYRKTDAVILMYSVDDSNSFDNLGRWISDARNSINNDNVVWVLVGNKSDLPLYVEQGDIDALRCQLNTTLSFFTSAKTGERVLSTFERAITETHNKFVSRPSQQVRPVNLVRSSSHTGTNEGSIVLAPDPKGDKEQGSKQQTSCCY